MKSYKIKGMDCASCATLIQMDLEDAGYECVCSYIKGTLEVINVHDTKRIAQIVKLAGYTLVSK